MRDKPPPSLSRRRDLLSMYAISLSIYKLSIAENINYCYYLSVLLPRHSSLKRFSSINIRCRQLNRHHRIENGSLHA